MRLYTFVYLSVDKSINELVGNPKVPLTNTPFPPSNLTHNGFGTSLLVMFFTRGLVIP
jgi:hypothetical protein